MSDARTLQINKADYRLSRLFFQRVWRIAKPYIMARGHAKEKLILLLMLAATPGWAMFNYWNARIANDMTNALVAKQADAYQSIFWFLTIVAFGSTAIQYAQEYLAASVNVHWRQWLTDWLVGRYLNRRTYYDIATREDLDNPDQRIQQDIPPFIEQIVAMPKQLISQVMALITGGFIIASISGSMMWATIIYSLISMVLTLLLYTPMIRRNFEVTISEADLRYGILHVRDNAETVAFYRGEETEHAQIGSRLGRAIRAARSVLRYNLFMNLVTLLSGNLWSLVPYFLVVPLFFQGKIQYGDIAMASMGSMQMQQSLTQLAQYIPQLTRVAPNAVRLAQIVERFDRMDAQHDQGGHRIQRRVADEIVTEHLSLETPGGEQRLFEDMSFQVPRGVNMVIVGQTGVGKSSLLRALAGLWTRGSGHVAMPDIGECLFLPQRPYMILGSLRSQLLYPRAAADTPDDVLRSVLARVALPDLLEKNGGLDAVRDWGKVLSLGEQQRIAFARILLSGATLVFLDEATSAVDIPIEAQLYQLLIEQGIGFVSVGHRETILGFHDQALELMQGGAWRMRPIGSAADTAATDMERECG